MLRGWHVLGVISFKWDNDDKKIAQAFQMLGLFICI